MQPQLAVIVVQPDDAVGTDIERAMVASGHAVLRVAAATWAIPAIRSDPPDIVLLERSSAGFERLLDTIDGLEVHVPVLVTRFSDVPPMLRHLDAPQAAEVVHRAERAVWKPFGGSLGW